MYAIFKYSAGSSIIKELTLLFKCRALTQVWERDQAGSFHLLHHGSGSHIFMPAAFQFVARATYII